MCYVNQKHASGNFPTWQLADGEEGGVEWGGVGGWGRRKKKKSPPVSWCQNFQKQNVCLSMVMCTFCLWILINYSINQSSISFFFNVSYLNKRNKENSSGSTLIICLNSILIDIVYLRVWHVAVDTIPGLISCVLHQRQDMFLSCTVRQATRVPLRLVQVTEGRNTQQRSDTFNSIEQELLLFSNNHRSWSVFIPLIQFLNKLLNEWQAALFNPFLVKFNAVGRPWEKLVPM